MKTNVTLEQVLAKASKRLQDCFPYNDDTKHLVGTTDETSDYYRYWED